MTATQPWTPIPPTTPARQGTAPATAGFVLGLVGLVVGWVPIVGLLVTVPALLLSRAGRARFRDGRASSAGRSGAGLVLGWIGTAICLLMTVFAFVGAARPPEPAAVVQPAAAPAPALLSVPDVVGMADAQARQVLAAAGFTTVVLGPSTGSVAGVAEGTVTTQLPGATALASAGDPITLGEAAAPPVPAAVPTAAPAAAPAAVEEPVADAPRVDAPRPFVAAPRAAVPAPAAPAPAAPAPASGGSSAHYANCSAAKAAGAAPLYRGDAGYRSALDRDGDGVACES
ncbi:excalibur calcium-binding domain-containing protein [Pseudonocardia halophobica]|uniref:excalibur calcium-binding domain-containing protein n=1 Tax=Pseudonocardia halophobica TaxID=29401 RepID=UPI003D9213C4